MATVQRLHKTPHISPEAFLRQVSPRKAALSNSILEPWYEQITVLLEGGCTLEQVRSFLGMNGVSITLTGISNYLQRRREKSARVAQDSQSIPHQPVRTLGCLLPDSEICRRNGWDVGTVLISEAAHGKSILRITAIGETHILAREVSRNGRATTDLASRELGWALAQREWRKGGEV